ncbi:MAG TPA: PilZ domain-containing protein [Pyrinomonadaceae bacterium]|nr:PilZ domain-containing protein [Pyrinomonadaceae bacterium]
MERGDCSPFYLRVEKDRRSAPRVRVKLPARWEGVLSREEATITDLSRNGCFVLSGGKIEHKELIWLEISLPEGPVSFWAEVVDAPPEIGFAVRFNSSSDEDNERLARYIESVFATRVPE